MTITSNSRVAIIDDGFRPWRSQDFPKASGLLADPDLDDFKALFKLSVDLELADETDDEEKQIAHLSSEDTIDTLVIDTQLPSKHPEIWERYFKSAVEQRAIENSWQDAIVTVLEKHQAQYKKYYYFPDPTELDEANLLIVDLVLSDDSDPLGVATNNLHRLYDHRVKHELTLPLVILISQNTSSLEIGRQDFRIKSRISASALRLLNKTDLTDSVVGPIRFEILWQQMCDEAVVANKMRELVNAMEEATEEAADELAHAMWNLDCDAMLRMYQTCLDDQASFSDYLIKFVSRSVAWHIRANKKLMASLGDIKNILSERSAKDADGLAFRFHSASEEDAERLRELTHHFHWLPHTNTVSFNELDDDEARNALEDYFPFGAVITTGSVQNKLRAWVHITQPCDLLRFAERYDSDSLTFVEGNFDQTGTKTNSDSQVLIGAARANGQYFDLVVNLKRGIAGKAAEMVTFFRNEQAFVMGQLRREIARDLGQQLASHTTRVNRPRFINLRNEYYYVLVGEKGKSPSYLLSEQKKLLVPASIRTRLGVRGNKRDQDCFHLLGPNVDQLAIECYVRFPNSNVDAAKLAFALKQEIVESKQDKALTDSCDIKVIKTENELKKARKAMHCTQAIGIALVKQAILENKPESA